MENDITLSTALREQAMKLVALREKQSGNAVALGRARSPHEKSAIKSQCQSTIKEIDELSKTFEEDLAIERYEQTNREALKGLTGAQRKVAFGDYDGEGSGPAADPRSLGQRVIESGEFRDGLRSIKSTPFSIELDDISIKSLRESQDAAHAMKATMTTGAGWAPYGPRVPGYVPSAQRVPSLADLIPQQDTESPIFYYMEETTFTNNAGYVAEGATKPESAFGLTSRTVQASKIATTLPVSEEQLEDVPQIREYIDNRGTLQIQLAEENALLNFTAGANNWDGFLQKPGVQTQAAGTDVTPTAVLKAMTKVQYAPGYAAMATGIAMNPTDWQNVLTMQQTTGAYIWSLPSAPTAMPDMRMWGMAVRPVAALPAGTALVGNFRMFSQIWRRSGLSIRMAYANDDALKNLVRIIFEERVALVISRATAFCKVTDLVE